MISDRREYEATVENARIWVLFDTHGTAPEEHKIDVNHIHQYVEVFVCCRGTLRFELYKNDNESETAVATENDCFLIPIEYSHHLISADEDAEWYSFGFHVGRIGRRGTAGLCEQLSVLKKMDVPCRLHGQNRFCNEVRRLFRSEYSKGACLPALQITVLLAELLKETGRAVAGSSADRLWMKDGNSQFTVLEHILAARYMEKLTYRTLADDLHISERQLSRIIKKRYGMTMHQVLFEKRLEAARRMMAKGETNLSKLATEVGFANGAAFRKAFFEKYGTTPRQYCETIAAHSEKPSAKKETT